MKNTSLVLRIDNRDFSGRISTYKFRKELTYGKVITTLDGEELFRNKRLRPVLTFSLIPYSEQTSVRDYEILSQCIFDVVYTDTDTNTIEKRKMRLVTSLDDIFLLDSVDGRRYYKGGEIQLRATKVE